MKNHVKKTLTLVVAIMLLFLTGCSIKLLPPQVNWDGDAEQSMKGCKEREKLSFFHLWPRGDDNYPLIVKFINDFNQSEIAGELGVCVEGSGVNFWDYWSKVDNLIYGGQSPDIYLHELSQTRYRMSNLLNLKPMAEADIAAGRDTLDPSESFYEAQLETATINGKLYSLPWSSTVRVIYYNKTLFNQAGLTESDLPKTWDELEEVSTQLTTYNDDGEYKTIGFDPFAGEGQYFHQWVWLNGGDFWEIDNENKFIPTFNSQDKIDTMNRLLNFPNRQDKDKLTDFMGQFALTGTDPFVSGKIGMIIGNEGTYFNLQQAKVKFDYGVFPIPPGPNKEDGVSVNWSGSFDIEIYDNHNRGNISKSKADLLNRASWEFVKYLYSRDIQKQLFDNSPFLLSHKEYLLEFNQGNEVLTGLANEIEHSREVTYVPMTPNWASDVYSEIQEIYKKTRSADVGLGRIQDDMARKVNQYCSINKEEWGC